MKPLSDREMRRAKPSTNLIMKGSGGGIWEGIAQV